MKAEYDFSKAKRGAVVKPAPGKTRITIRLDNEVIDWFRAHVNDAGGGNYQTPPAWACISTWKPNSGSTCKPTMT